jgi:hypothetical protein
MHAYASSVKAVYSSLLIILPDGSPETVIFAIQASPSGSLLTFAGVFSSSELTSATVPLMGVRMSEADLTDSTAPIASPSLTSMSVWGSSMYTTSPRALAAYSEIPRVPGALSVRRGVLLWQTDLKNVHVLPSADNSIHSWSSVYFFSFTANRQPFVPPHELQLLFPIVTYMRQIPRIAAAFAPAAAISGTQTARASSPRQKPVGGQRGQQKKKQPFCRVVCAEC